MRQHQHLRRTGTARTQQQSGQGLACQILRMHLFKLHLKTQPFCRAHQVLHPHLRRQADAQTCRQFRQALHLPSMSLRQRQNGCQGSSPVELVREKK